MGLREVGGNGNTSEEAIVIIQEKDVTLRIIVEEAKSGKIQEIDRYRS